MMLWKHHIWCHAGFIGDTIGVQSTYFPSLVLYEWYNLKIVIAVFLICSDSLCRCSNIPVIFFPEAVDELHAHYLLTQL